MRYFAWILGVGLAVTFGILNGMWHEFRSEDGETDAARTATPLRPKA